MYHTKRPKPIMVNTSKGNAVWELFKSAVPGLAEKVAPIKKSLDDAAVDFQQLAVALPGDINSRVQSCQNPDNPEWNQSLKHVWCLCDMAEGEFPKTYQFDTVQKLAASIAKFEGRETALVAFYGVALPFSKIQVNNEGKRCRYLLLPNDMAAVVSDQFRLIEKSLLPVDLEVEAQGWVGDPAHLESCNYYKPGYVEEDDFSSDEETEE